MIVIYRFQWETANFTFLFAKRECKGTKKIAHMQINVQFFRKKVEFYSTWLMITTHA